MMHHLSQLIHAIWITALAESLLALLVTALPHMRSARRISEAFCRAPMLDLLVASFTWIPWVVACAFAGSFGLLGAFLGQVIALMTWTALHELIYRDAARGPRIVKFINRTVGRWRNHLALWITVIAVPGFWLIRFLQIAAYWPLVVLLGFPKYNQSEWINVSRQKFDGLVGHDLIWCLYCDWMTGVYSLGAEMLRNVESFWCPIRFYDGKKCDNCKLDFPDVAHGWVPATATMSDVEQVLESQYAGGNRAWFGHPTRITVHGRPAGEPNGDGNGAATGEELPADQRG